MCTATPISYDAARDETWLVSAAHCFVDRKDAAQAVAATGFAALGAGDAAQGMPQHGWYAYKGADVDYSRAATGDANAFKIKAVYVPSDYCKGSAVVNGDCPNQNLDNPAKADNDIALVRLAGKFGQPGLYPKLPTPGVYPKLYDQILTAGYGIRAPGVQAPANHLHLHYANTNYGGRSADLPGYHYLFNGNIVGNDNMMFMTCPGDSGGPDLWWDGADWVLISAHATGVGACGQDGNPYLPPQAAPDISTDVGPYKDWINSILAAPSVCGVGNKCACSKNVNPIYSDAALICQ
ncbi:MAG TPA: trypsin-like serine protease [Paucimonas sp.]|nr:trypsin-like serine protease [Paucimonas sp.]